MDFQLLHVRLRDLPCRFRLNRLLLQFGIAEFHHDAVGSHGHAGQQHDSFDAPDTCSEKTDAGIFDVTSKAEGTALDGTKYKDW